MIAVLVAQILRALVQKKAVLAKNSLTPLLRGYVRLATTATAAAAVGGPPGGGDPFASRTPSGGDLLLEAARKVVRGPAESEPNIDAEVAPAFRELLLRCVPDAADEEFLEELEKIR